MPRRSTDISFSATARRGSDEPGLGAALLDVGDLPRWAREAIECGTDERQQSVVGVEPCSSAASVEVRSGPALTLVSVILPRAAELDGAGMKCATAAIYGLVRARLLASQTPHPIRIWNFIPGIGAATGPALNRYMSFNLGRYEGLRAWFGDEDRFEVLLPTATGVGHGGGELAVHVLASGEPARPVENPRQRPAYRYSKRFGPRPPCFARAAAVSLGGRERLLIGGTASVCGEDSVHVGSVSAQLEETLVNLAAVVRSADEGCGGAGAGALGRIVEARAYCPDRASMMQVSSELRRRLLNVEHVELVHAELCRPELLVEVEAVAEIDRFAGPTRAHQ